jgi:hypothetical protein
LAKQSYKKNLVQNPDHEVGAGLKLTGRDYPSSTYMNNNLVPGSNCYIEIGWIHEVPQPNPHILAHVHNYDEIVMHIGGDSKNPEELGAEIEFVVGGDNLIINKTSAVFIPKGVSHGPLTWKKVTKPHMQMVVMPGAGTIQEADPAGYLELHKK